MPNRPISEVMAMTVQATPWRHGGGGSGERNRNEIGLTVVAELSSGRTGEAGETPGVEERLAASEEA